MNHKSFKSFLIESTSTTNEEKDRLKTIIQKLIANDKQWFKDYQIMVGDKGNYWILNYGIEDKNEYNKLVRGMVVKKPEPNWHGDYLSLIKSFPFIRFLNQGETGADPVDLNNAEMLEKMDGSMIGVSFPSGNYHNPEFHTRRMMSSSETDMKLPLTTFHGKTFAFMPLIKKYVDQLKFNDIDVPFTYVFEFLHEASYVLTKYRPDQYGLYLLGARNLITHHELSESELDHIAARIQANRPRRFDAVSDRGTILKMFDDISKETPDFEGFIFRDKITGKRLKVKDPKYVEKHHLIDSVSYKNLIPLILKGESDEVMAYLPPAYAPFAKKITENFIDKFNKYVDHAVNLVHYYGDKKLDRKSLAFLLFDKNEVKDKFLKSLIMTLHQTLNKEEVRQFIIENLKTIALGRGKNEGSPRKLIDLLGIHEEENEKYLDVSEI